MVIPLFNLLSLTITGRVGNPGRDQQLCRNVRFRGGPVFKAHRLVYHSTLGWRVMIKRREGPARSAKRLLRQTPALRFKVYFLGLRIGVWGLGLRIRSLGVRIESLGLRVEG